MLWLYHGQTCCPQGIAGLVGDLLKQLGSMHLTKCCTYCIAHMFLSKGGNYAEVGLAQVVKYASSCAYLAGVRPAGWSRSVRVHGMCK